MTEMLYVNAATTPYGEHTSTIALNRWPVANAPRPLPGAVAFVGPFLHGIYFAAGPQGVFGERWRDLDAWPVELITNFQIVERLIALAQARHTTLAKLLGDQGLPRLAAAAGFPWFASPGATQKPVVVGAPYAR